MRSLDRYAASCGDFVFVAPEPHSGPRRAKRAEKILSNQSTALRGYQGRSRWLVLTGVAPALFSGWLVVFAATPERAIAQVEDHQYRTEDIQTGSRLYGAQCALCHGQNGDGVVGVNLARQQFRRASSDDDIRNTITTGVRRRGHAAVPTAAGRTRRARRLHPFRLRQKRDALQGRRCGAREGRL